VGLYMATTGPDHDAGEGQNILFGTVPSTTFNTIHSFTTGADYLQRSGAVTPTNVFTLDRFGVVTPIGTTGFRTTYTLPGPPTTLDRLTIVSEVTVQGETAEDSAVDVKTIVTNDGDAPVAIGIRYLWDFQIAEDDGPTFQAVNPDSSVALTREHKFLAPAFESYRIEDNDEGAASPTFVVYGSVSGPPALTPTPPDQLQYVCWPTAKKTPFVYTGTTEPSVCGDDNGEEDSAVLYYFGPDAERAITIPPGGSHTVSASLFATKPPGFSIELSPRTATNDVGTQHTITATVTNQQGSRMPGQRVLFIISGANTANCLDAPRTDSNGQTTCRYGGNAVGDDQVVAWVDEFDNDVRDLIEPSDLVTATWTPVYTVTLAPPTANRDVGTQHTVTATVVDHRGNPAPDLDVAFTVRGANIADCFDAPLTDSHGQTTCTYIGEIPGGDTITAWVDEVDDNVLAPDEFFGTATASWQPVYTITLTPATMVRDVGTDHIVTANVVDHNDQPASGVPVNFQVVGLNRMTQTIPTVGGQAVFRYQGRQNQSEVDTITAWVDENGNNLPDPSESPVSATVTWRKIGIRMEVSGEGNAVSVVRTITVTVANDLGIAIQAVTVGFKVEGGTVYQPTLKVTNVNGQAVFTYTSAAPAPILGAAPNVPGTQVGTAATQQVAFQQNDTITVWVELGLPGSPATSEPQLSISVVTAVRLVSFESLSNGDGTVTLRWETAAELDNAGFNLYRATTSDGPYIKVNDQLIPGQGTGYGARYSYLDTPPASTSFYYKLEDIDYYGMSTFHGPIEVQLAPTGGDESTQLYLPLIQP
jgi:hypothetical protein